MPRKISSNHYPALSGFSLIELSIVLVIIGLITGAVLVGQSMYHNASVTSIISDAQSIQSDMKAFKDRYEYYPGDFPNAISLWGAMTSPAACDTAGTASTGRFSVTPVALTCDGRGNGFIGMYWTDSTQFTHAAPDANTDLRELRERFYVWQHLSLAGYLNEQFSGHSYVTGSNTAIEPGINVPESDYGRGKPLGYTIQYSPTINAAQSATRSWPVQGNIGHLFSWSDPTTGVAVNDLISSLDARKIDAKIDDGLPFSGKIFAHGRDSGTVNVNSCTTGTAYQVTDDYSCGQYWRNFLEE